MSVQLIVIAVLAAVTSPTAVAAVLLILNQPHPVRLLTGYVVGSFVMSMLIGFALVAGLAATTLFAPRRHEASPVLDIALGLLILLSAAWLRSPRSDDVRRRAAARRARRRAETRARRGDRPSRSAQVLTSGSVGLVAALGAAMHLPGLLYLAGLGEIAQTGTSRLHALVLLLFFNLVMLAPIELPLAGYVLAPARTRSAIGRMDTYIRTHRTEGLLVGSLLAGGYLLVIGIVELLS